MRPEFLIQQLRIRLHLNSRAGHCFFLLAQNLPQRFNFRIHTVQHLLHRVHTQFAALVTIQGKANRHMFGQFQQHRLVRLVRRRLRCQPSQRLLQRVLRAHRHCG